VGVRLTNKVRKAKGGHVGGGKPSRIIDQTRHGANTEKGAVNRTHSDRGTEGSRFTRRNPKDNGEIGYREQRQRRRGRRKRGARERGGGISPPKGLFLSQKKQILGQTLLERREKVV